MQHQRIVTTAAIVMQTVEFQQGFETGLNGAYVAAALASSESFLSARKAL